MAHPSATTLASPLGPLTAVTAGDGDALVGLYFDDHRPAPPRASSSTWRGAQARTRNAPARRLAEALDEYFAGERTTFGDVPIRLHGTPFQRAVWDALRTVPYGTTATYGELARRLDLGRPGAAAGAARAVGAANARNPVSILVPCHRLVASTGALAGYAGGTWRKRFLLELEGAVTT